eukprot:TRINITY_DN20833_c0_g1_i2.p1 TRINITY_DN20833_c0_g1~~TRINITY_DN20833_c0_g1_i2.p1  ORF type:complete len:255 (-),score=81.25 TRINITY_DN20833_c0_g1_i2:328-1038(-)
MATFQWRLVSCDWGGSVLKGGDEEAVYAKNIFNEHAVMSSSEVDEIKGERGGCKGGACSGADELEKYALLVKTVPKLFEALTKKLEGTKKKQKRKKRRRNVLERESDLLDEDSTKDGDGDLAGCGFKNADAQIELQGNEGGAKVDMHSEFKGAGGGSKDDAQIELESDGDKVKVYAQGAEMPHDVELMVDEFRKGRSALRSLDGEARQNKLAELRQLLGELWRRDRTTWSMLRREG